MSTTPKVLEVLAKEGKKPTEFCLKCIKTRVAKIDGPVSEELGVPLYRKGDFIIDCKGIPDEHKYIPRQDSLFARLEKESGEKLSDEEKYDLSAMYDSIFWAEKYLGWKPRKSNKGEPFQENMLRCSSKRKVSRLGRRNGKSEINAS